MVDDEGNIYRSPYLSKQKRGENMAQKLHAYDDRTPLNLTEEEKQAILQMIQEINTSLTLLDQRITNGAQNSDVSTCIGLLEHRLPDLSKITGYDGILAKQVEERHAKVRKLNCRIRELEEQRGKEINATATTSALQRYEDTLRTWHEACGFRYANIQCKLSGLRVKFNSKLRHERKRRLSRNDEMFARFVKMTPFLPELTDWDIIKNDYSSELADTDENRQNLIRLFTEEFPNVRINRFEARKNDCGSFLLGIDVYIPYEDIERLQKKALEM